MKPHRLSLLIILAGSLLAAEPPESLGHYNVTWSSQSRDSSESMPVGGGDVGLNVWVENGDLLFCLQRSGTFDENNEFLKLGRVRVRLDPNPFAPGAVFRQELRLREGYVAIHGELPDGLSSGISV